MQPILSFILTSECFISCTFCQLCRSETFKYCGSLFYTNFLFIFVFWLCAFTTLCEGVIPREGQAAAKGAELCPWSVHTFGVYVILRGTLSCCNFKFLSRFLWFCDMFFAWVWLCCILFGFVLSVWRVLPCSDAHRWQSEGGPDTEIIGCSFIGLKKYPERRMETTEIFKMRLASFWITLLAGNASRERGRWREGNRGQ